MSERVISISGGIRFGNSLPLVLIAGPCVMESEAVTMAIAEDLAAVCGRLKVSLVFKASYDKANRSSVSSFRGVGIAEGLRILASVRERFGVPVVTDVHTPAEAAEAARSVDLLQIPAFLCRQTDLVTACAATGLPVNVKKGQFLAPEDMSNIAGKAEASGNGRVLFTERGTTFGYHDLVVDMRGLAVMKESGVPVVFDATHSVQTPGGRGTSSGGRREFVLPLARAAAAVGVAGLFVEVHPDPDRALSDGPNSLPLDGLPLFLEEVLAIDRLVKSAGARPGERPDEK